MPRYTVKDGPGTLGHDGKIYRAGESVELTEEQAKAVKHILAPPEKPAPKEPAKRAAKETEKK